MSLVLSDLYDIINITSSCTWNPFGPFLNVQLHCLCQNEKFTIIYLSSDVNRSVEFGLIDRFYIDLAPVLNK